MGNENKHHHAHGHHHHHDTSHNILFALVINVLFAVLELFGGAWTNSVAIISDALHDFGDALSLGAAWYLERVSKKPRDQFFSFGYRRFSLLGSVIVSFVLLVGLAFVVHESIGRILNPQPAKAQGMLYFALLGIVVNGIAALRLRGGHSHNERAVFLHMLEDVLGWVAVLISSVLMLFFDMPILDPLVSLGISAFILYNIFKNLWAVTKILMLHVPENTDPEKLREQMQNVKGVNSIEDLHIWTLDGTSHILTVQVIISKQLNMVRMKSLKQKLRTIAAAEGIQHSTIEFCTGNDEIHHHD